MKNDDELLALRHDFFFYRRSTTHYDSGVAFAPVGTRLALDAGCGSGGFALPLAKRARRVVGLDRNEMLIARARARQSDAQIQNVEWCEQHCV